MDAPSFDVFERIENFFFGKQINNVNGMAIVKNAIVNETQINQYDIVIRMGIKLITWFQIISNEISGAAVDASGLFIDAAVMIIIITMRQLSMIISGRIDFDCFKKSLKKR